MIFQFAKKALFRGILRGLGMVPLFVLICLIVSCAGPFFGLPEPENRPYFWKVEKGDQTSWFLGTFHIGVSLDDLLCWEVIADRLKNSDLVLTELAQPTRTEKEVKQWVKVLHHSPNSKDFKNLHPDYQNFLRSKGITDTRLNYTILSYEVSRLCIEEGLGKEALQISMDGQVEAVADFLDIPLQALDTLELRKPMLRFDTKASLERQIAHYPQCPGAIQSMVAHYKMGGFVSDGRETEEQPNRKDIDILKNRNEKWAVQFKTAGNSYDRIFMAAGLSHFTGHFNLIDMLRKDGFHIERLPCRPKASPLKVLTAQRRMEYLIKDSSLRFFQRKAGIF